MPNNTIQSKFHHSLTSVSMRMRPNAEQPMREESIEHMPSAEPDEGKASQTTVSAGINRSRLHAIEATSQRL
jgi:hypothetical protein